MKEGIKETIVEAMVERIVEGIINLMQREEEDGAHVSHLLNNLATCENCMFIYVVVFLVCL